MGRSRRINGTLVWCGSSFGFFLSFQFIPSFLISLFFWLIFNEVFLCCFSRKKSKHFDAKKNVNLCEGHDGV